MIEFENKLKKFGIGRSIFKIIHDYSIEINNESYLYRVINTSIQNGISCNAFSKLLNLDVALENITDSDHINWVIHNFLKIASFDNIEVRSKSVAELVSFGLLNKIFKESEPLREKKHGKNPDLRLKQKVFTEIYCPQKSQIEIDKVKIILNEQNSIVRIATSYPITGSNGKALEYPANKTIDRVLNHKWTNDQTIENAVNILWIDLLQGLELSSLKLKPFESINHAELTYIGCFGVWHAFYGEKNTSKFVKERTSLKYINFRNSYDQQRNGLFRDRRNLSAALLLTTDGIVLFENPWASVRLKNEDKQEIKTIFRFRPEYSFFEIENGNLTHEDRINNELAIFGWLIN